MQYKKESMLINKLILVVGFDQTEAVAYHNFCQSVLEKASIPVQFIPLAQNTLYFYNETHTNGSNKFIYSRFLTPYICDFQGFAVFADGDMICNVDIAELQKLFDSTKAVQVVKHSYKTKRSVKYLNNKNVDYPRKNWSSFIIFNCSHPANRVLTPDFIQSSEGSFLHRFSWLADSDIGNLPLDWNYLAIEYESNSNAKLIHYTLGTPCFEEFKSSEMSDIWWSTYKRTSQGLDQ